MSTNIDSLSYEELLELHQKITDRLIYLDSVKPAKLKHLFNPGDEVSFKHPTLGILSGILLKHQANSVTVVADNGQHWSISPHLLRKIVSRESCTAKSEKIIGIRKLD